MKKIITKKELLERFLEIDEMAHNENPEWPTTRLQFPLIFQLENFTIKKGKSVEIRTKDPETGEFLDGIIVSDRIRTSPNGIKLLEFNNYERGNPRGFERRWIELDQNNEAVRAVNINPKIIDGAYGHLNLPKDKKRYGLELKKDVDTIDAVDLDDSEVRDTTEEVSKRKINSLINSFFGKSAIKMKLNSMVTPIILAGAKYTEKTTNVLKKFNFSGPDMYFQYHSQYNFKEIGDMLDKLLEYKYKIDNNEEVSHDLFGIPNHQVRNYANYIYKNGKWDTSNALGSKDVFDVTRIRRLYKKSVQRGEMKLGVVSELTVSSFARNGIIGLNVMLKSFNNVRTLGNRWGERDNNIFDIRTFSSSPIPEETDLLSISVKNYSKLYQDLFKDCFNQLQDKLMQLDEDEILNKLVIDPSVIGYSEEN
jgi:hypothetical protein